MTARANVLRFFFELKRDIFLKSDMNWQVGGKRRTLCYLECLTAAVMAWAELALEAEAGWEGHATRVFWAAVVERTWWMSLTEDVRLSPSPCSCPQSSTPMRSSSVHK